MFFYYLCEDNETIYRVEVSLNKEKKNAYLSLLENYLTELLFYEEKEFKKIIKKEEIETENKEYLSIEDMQVILEKSVVVQVEKLEDYLPLLVTIKTKKYFLPHSFTICFLVRFFLKDIDKINNPYFAQIANCLSSDPFIDFRFILKYFFDDSGNVFPEKNYDYYSFINLFKNMEFHITRKYLKSKLVNFWQGDEAERCIANTILSTSLDNKLAQKKLNFKFIEYILNR